MIFYQLHIFEMTLKTIVCAIYTYNSFNNLSRLYVHSFFRDENIANESKWRTYLKMFIFTRGLGSSR